MTVPVLTAGGAGEWESSLVAGLSAGDHGVRVVRRCVDVGELIAAAAAGLGRAALVGADLRGLDGDVLTRLAVGGLAVVGVAAAGDDDGRRRLERLGVRTVLVPPIDAHAVATAVVAATSMPPPVFPFDLADATVTLPRPTEPPDDEEVAAAAGRVVAVWGPTGAPGRSSVAVTIASELADLGVSTLLVDADVYGGVVAQLLGLLDESAGIAVACRAATNGTLDETRLAQLALQVRPRLQVLTGIARADRWPELRASAVEAVIGAARDVAAVTVVDCGFSLEQDEELSFDTAAPRRNGATLAALTAADVVIGVASADPVGLQRYVRTLADLTQAVPSCRPMTVVNKVRAAVVGGGDAEAEISAALARFAGLDDVSFVPLDVAAFDSALATGRTLLEVAPASPARAALRSVAAQIAGVDLPLRRRRLLRRR